MKRGIITEGEIIVFIKDFVNYEGNAAQFWCFKGMIALKCFQGTLVQRRTVSHRKQG